MNHWIDAPRTLADRLAAWGGNRPVALDTEFVRERTWYAQLALVQLAVPGEVLLVDPLVEGMTAVLAPWLADESVLKLMHSPSEDLHVLTHVCGTPPAPLFDTQAAAALAGLGPGMSYQRLVEAVTGVALEKGETRSDWLRRPLREAQLAYAADDVLHLHALHAELEARLRTLGRLDWLEADCARMVRQALHDEPERWPHLGMRGAQLLDADGQRRLHRLLRWREARARQQDRPKNWILDGELAMSLARRPPPDLRSFNAVLDAHPKAPRRDREALFDLVRRDPDAEELAMPLASPPSDVEKKRLRALQDAVAAAAGELHIPEGLLASRRHLEALMGGTGWGALDGWRRAILEPRLAPLLATDA